MRMATASGIVLSLSYEVGRDPLGITLGAHHHQLRWAGDEINSTLACNQFLGSGHVTVSGTHDLLHARHAFRPIGKRGDSLRSPKPVDSGHPQHMSGDENGGSGPGRGDQNLPHSRHLCRDDAHEDG